MDGSQKLAPNSLHLGNTPAQQSADLRSLLCLSMLPGIGPRTLCLLLEHFGTANEVLAASSEQLAVVSGVGPKLIHTIRTADHFVDPDHVLAWCDEHNVEVLQQNSAAYPQGLLEQPDAPPILFSLGLPTGADRLAVAIVGTRHATSYGTRQADRLAYGLAKAGVTVVSGLVRNPAELKLNDLERKVLESVEPSNTSIDQVIAVSGLPAHQVMATLSVLEMRKLIRRLSGQYVSRI
ncbi:DNA-processing protein DprA [Rhodopirellula sp. MGV]|uniref:DNA-processing protein DprA n=1 Tax=Rhodopirellula sp. MGV TaxID=2023130 RepID=UPI000B971C87|nr:DNA-processing protein DprA [Rhodopirellula sp. MGV]OYP38067.1 hypothetical protein CGZ80_03490 [Rhodopirellula sp. MGV]